MGPETDLERTRKVGSPFKVVALHAFASGLKALRLVTASCGFGFKQKRLVAIQVLSDRSRRQRPQTFNGHNI